MKGGTVQINWHGTKPVLTLDFHPATGILATGGADFDIKVVIFVIFLLCGHFVDFAFSVWAPSCSVFRS